MPNQNLFSNLKLPNYDPNTMFEGILAQYGLQTKTPTALPQFNFYDINDVTKLVDTSAENIKTFSEQFTSMISNGVPLAIEVAQNEAKGIPGSPIQKMQLDNIAKQVGYLAINMSIQKDAQESGIKQLERLKNNASVVSSSVSSPNPPNTIPNDYENRLTKVETKIDSMNTEISNMVNAVMEKLNAQNPPSIPIETPKIENQKPTENPKQNQQK